MTPPPTPEALREVRFVDHGDDEGVARAPIWTESGRTELSLVITVRPKRYENLPMQFWGSFVSGVIDEQGATLLSPSDAPAPPAPPYPAWSEQQPGQLANDPRIARGAFVGVNYGIRFDQVVNGVRRVHPDPLEALDSLNEGLAAIVLLQSFFAALYSDGISSAYERVDVDGAPRRLVTAAELVGASSYADVFARVEQGLPQDVRSTHVALQSYLEVQEQAALDSGEDATFLDAYESEIYSLEDRGDAIWQHMTRYVESHPEQFFTPE